MSSIYARHRIQNVKDIRILSLLPAESLSDALRGELKVVDLASSGDFEALSYTWGPPFERQVLENDVIEISGQTLSITGNLSHALRRLRLATAPLTLWVDAICIDQGDSAERGHQVGFMAEVFRSAARVIAWLGEDSEYRDGQWFVEYHCDTERFWRELNIDKSKLRESFGSAWDIDQPSDAQNISGHLAGAKILQTKMGLARANRCSRYSFRLRTIAPSIHQLCARYLELLAPKSLQSIDPAISIWHRSSPRQQRDRNCENAQVLGICCVQ